MCVRRARSARTSASRRTGSQNNARARAPRRTERGSRRNVAAADPPFPAAAGAPLEVSQERVARALAAHRGSRSVSWVDRRRVGKLEEAAEASLHVERRRVREVAPPYRPGEDEIARKCPAVRAIDDAA